MAGVPLIELLKDMTAGLGVHTAAMVSDSHNRAALHGGAVTVDSRPGSGSCFTVALK